MSRPSHTRTTRATTTSAIGAQPISAMALRIAGRAGVTTAVPGSTVESMTAGVYGVRQRSPSGRPVAAVGIWQDGRVRLRTIVIVLLGLSLAACGSSAAPTTRPSAARTAPAAAAALADLLQAEVERAGGSPVTGPGGGPGS